MAATRHWSSRSLIGAPSLRLAADKAAESAALPAARFRAVAPRGPRPRATSDVSDVPEDGRLSCNCCSSEGVAEAVAAGELRAPAPVP